MRIVKWIGFGLLFGLGFGFLTMQLWNWLVPVLFAGPVINFWQAIGLLVLSKILFGGFKGGHCGRWGGHHGCGHGGHHGYWKKRMEERMAGMTPEEKEKYRNKCCSWGGTDSNQEKPL